ncbi:MAG TPA: hypothetical protein VII45_10080 [Solirubrobacterales bacterium]
MRKKTLIAVALVLALIGVAAGAAYALRLRVGDIVINADGGFSPKALPKYENAPITLYGGGKLSTVSGALPPILETISIEFDRHGAVETTGLPVCKEGKLEATTVAAARQACPGAIVGEGEGKALIAFPEQRPFPVSSPITLFNGPPKHGDPTVFAHAYTTVPVPTTFVVPIVIETIHDGVYGYRTKARIPKIAGGSGVPISGSLKIGRTWTYKGKRYSYVSARCETGRLQAKGEFTFSDGTFLIGTFLRPCTVRR